MKVDPAWYQTAFGEDYPYRYAHRDEEEAREGCALAIRASALAPEARVLDLCCGAGRHLLCLRAASRQTIGGDLSKPLLDQVREKLPGIPLVRLDMRRLPFSSASFDLITNFFTAFGYFETDEENFQVFAEVARVLSPNGFFFLDFINAELAAERLRRETGTEREAIFSDGTRWLVRRSLGAQGTRAVKLQRQVDNEGREVARIEESIRLFTRDELERGMDKAGLEPIRLFGDYAGGPFVPAKSERCIILARRRVGRERWNV